MLRHSIFVLRPYYFCFIFFSCLFGSSFAQADYAFDKEENSSGSFSLANWVATPEPRKSLYIKVLMEQAGINGIEFSHTADFYSAQLDALAAYSKMHGYSQFLAMPMARQFASVALINCDWIKGEGALAFAQKHLGNNQIDALADIFPEAVTQLKQGCSTP